MILNCITAIVIVAIICTAIVVNSYISKKTADYKAILKKRKEFMSNIGCYLYRINKNFERIDVEKSAREQIGSDLHYVREFIYKYCDEIN